MFQVFMFYLVSWQHDCSGRGWPNKHCCSDYWSKCKSISCKCDFVFLSLVAPINKATQVLVRTQLWLKIRCFLKI